MRNLRGELPYEMANDTQIRVIGAVEPEICTKMLREKLRATFPAT